MILTFKIKNSIKSINKRLLILGLTESEIEDYFKFLDNRLKKQINKPNFSKCHPFKFIS